MLNPLTPHPLDSQLTRSSINASQSKPAVVYHVLTHCSGRLYLVSVARVVVILIVVVEVVVVAAGIWIFSSLFSVILQLSS